ncbi:hypothetical protein [Streptomyces sp. NBC_00726]|uniref:hypothetical protein n=1 Tax=Streptomyces sp. NBC_00726 TaxID=2903674 RepID=UPI00386CE058
MYDERLVTVETTTGVMVFRDPRDIRMYLDEFAGYEELTLFGEDAVTSENLGGETYEMHETYKTQTMVARIDSDERHDLLSGEVRPKSRVVEV